MKKKNKLEHKEKQKKRRKTVKKEITNIKSSLDWMDIEEVNEKHIVLKRGKQKEIVVGVKLEPRSLFLEQTSEQSRSIHKLRVSLNRVPGDLWHGFVFNPVNLDAYMNQLSKQMLVESDAVILEMLEDDQAKAQMFIQEYRELEFFMMMKGKPNQKFEDQFKALQQLVELAGFHYKVLNRMDYDNYIAYAFENEWVNDYYFSRGVFDLKVEDYITKEVEDDEIEFD